MPLDADRLMREAIAVCQRGILAGQSPFGAVIANRRGEVIHAAHNGVRSECDPTAHAEVVAIRAACRQLETIDLSGHVMVSTCEPCPMCASAIHWSRLDAVVFGARISDARAAGFNELDLPIEFLFETGKSTVEVLTDVLRDECAALFSQWRSGPNPATY